MTYKAQEATPGPSRISRLVGLGSTQPGQPSRRAVSTNSWTQPEEDWYIPYNGPYEAPTPSISDVQRDSWGEPVDVGRYTELDADAQNRRTFAIQDERNGVRGRTRTVSATSYQTKSSGSIDPGRTSIGSSPRQQTHTNHTAVPLPSHLHTDLDSGREDVRRRTLSTGSTRKKSPIGALIFGRKGQAPNTSLGVVARTLSPKDVAPPPIPPSQSVGDSGSPGSSTTPLMPTSSPSKVAKTHVVDPPPRDAEPREIIAPPTPRPNKTPVPHPYSRASAAIPSPRRKTSPAPPSPTDPLSAPASATSMYHHRALPTGPNLHTSASTPNLRRAKPPPSLSLKERWFSAETWCDALLFPRPRFKVKQASGKSRGRLVSPPGSPLTAEEKNGHDHTTEPHSVPSRVLAHSRSKTDLRQPDGFEDRDGNTRHPEREDRPPLPPVDAQPEMQHIPHSKLPLQAHIHPAPQEATSSPLLRAPRPKSFALDDMALPSPIPSLATVLEQKQWLDQSRIAWKEQATQSFQNNLSRTLSKKRSKSVGAGRRKPDGVLDFLAARSLLGRQSTMPTVVVSPPNKEVKREEHLDSLGRISHSYKSSLSKTISSKSSRSQSAKHGHSRDDSWSRSAIKKAKDAALCGFGDAPSPLPLSGQPTEDGSENDGVLRDLLIPSVAPVSPFGPLSSSPVPSGISDSQVGIALSTPPPDHYDMEAVRLPSHPYAQGGRYTQTSSFLPKEVPDQQDNRKEHNFAGPHPVHYDVAASGLEHARNHSKDINAPKHPYASANDSQTKLTAHHRFDSTASPPSRMWAQAGPGVYQEVVPSALGGGPDMTRLTADPHSQRAASRRNNDRVSIGEALSYSMFEMGSHDSGLGTSEGGHHMDYVPEGMKADFGQVDIQESSTSHSRNRSIGRQPVMYDVNRPIHTLSQAQSSEPSHLTIGSLGSSILENPVQRVTPPPNERHGSSGEVTSRASSPPISPPPLGNFDDMDTFRDLFYRPEIARTDSDGSAAAPKNGAPITRGLSSLTRKLSQELAQMQASSRRQQSSQRLRERFNADSDQIVEPEATSPLRFAPPHSQAFQPSATLPEDVGSSRASSPFESVSEEDHALRLSNVAAVSTPSLHTSDYRLSQRLSLVEEEDAFVMPRNRSVVLDLPALPPRDSLQPPSSANNYARVSSGAFTRSSMITSSTSLSRMSGLSDFPSPPEFTSAPAHASIINAFFDESVEAPTAAEFQQQHTSDDTHESEPELDRRRFTFGADSCSPALTTQV